MIFFNIIFADLAIFGCFFIAKLVFYENDK